MRRARVPIALCGLALVVTSASAEGGWVLWSRPCDVAAQTCTGKWERRQVFEAERWCRAARTAAVNQAFTPEGQKLVRERGTIREFQCFPESADPREPKPQ
jgi:hypothetical protein